MCGFDYGYQLQGIIHPVVARIIWSDDCASLSPYRFCDYGPALPRSNKQDCGYNCNSTLNNLGEKLYVLDFAGGGAVHLIGECVLAYRYCRKMHKHGPFLEYSPVGQTNLLCIVGNVFRWYVWIDGVSVCQVPALEGYQRSTS